MARLIADGAERLVTFTRCQHRRDALTRDFGWYPGLADRIYWHDLSDIDRLERTFAKCEIVIHAAAAKVVGAYSDEPEGLLQTNVIGTENVIKAAWRAGVQKVLVISSDKAVQPTNAYGMSKAKAEQITVSANAYTQRQNTRCAAIRYGNVCGSTESVTVKWLAAMARGESIQLTDPRMTRFWLTLPQAVDHVLRAVEMMRGGEIFVPHLPAAKITTLAQAICGPDHPYTVTGIRPGGEKLHESLLSEDDIRRTVKWRGFYVVTPSKPDLY